METRTAPDHRIEPEFLGPLGDRPLVESAGKSSPDDLFPGASKFLSARVQRKRREQWNAVRPMVKRLLQPDEHVLHVAYAQQVPSLVDQFGLKHMYYAYHQVVLVITDQRIIEALLNARGKGPGTRLRSYSYRNLTGLKQSLGKLTATPAQGKKHAWRFGIGGDRKLVNLLLPRLQPRLAVEGTGHSAVAPQWHCPRCGAGVPPAPESCPGCRTTFRSARTAAMLSLAFPGGGLFYLGHPLLALTLIFREAMVLVVWAGMLLAETGKDSLVVPIVGGLALFALVKLAGWNETRVLARRSIPEPEGHRERAFRWGMAGAAASILLIAGAVPLAAAARPRIDHDLDASGDGADWKGSRKRSEWAAYAQNTDARSQWTDTRSGATLTVFAYTRPAMAETADFRKGWVETMKKSTTRTFVDDEKVPAPFHGFRYAGGIRTQKGEELSLVSYFVDDAEANDLHEVRILVPVEQEQAAEEVVSDFLQHARFIPASAPLP